MSRQLISDDATADPRVLSGHLPDGWTARLLDVPGDDDGVVRLVAAYDAVMCERLNEPPQRLLEQIRLVPDAGVRDVIVVLDPTSTVRGLMTWEVDAEDADPPQAWFDVYAHPDLDATQRTILEAGLIAAGHARTRSWAQRLGAETARAQTGVYRRDTSLADGFRHAGMAHTRTFFEMVIDLGPDADDVGVAPSGVQVERVGIEQAPLVHRMIEESFADHWDHHAQPYAEWQERRDNDPATDPSQWWMAFRDGVPIGICSCNNSRAAIGGGYVHHLGVLRPGRGQGIGQHLLRVAFAEHLHRGFAWTALHVDSTSPTGADRLYRSVGMHEGDTIDAYRIDLAAD